MSGESSGFDEVKVLVEQAKRNALLFVSESGTVYVLDQWLENPNRGEMPKREHAILIALLDFVKTQLTDV